MPKVLICDQVDVDRLSLGPSIEVDYRPSITREELLNSVGEYDALIIRSRTKVDRAVLEKAARLRLVARPGTGLDNVDVEYAEARGVQVVNSPESLVEAVAEHVMMLMLAISRRVVRADESTRAGKWEKSSLLGTELKGKVLGIVGLGRIGKRIAEVSLALGMSILVHDVIPIPDEVIRRVQCRVVSLDELFRDSDFVTLHVPLTADTRHMVNADRLAMMKRRAVIVNTSRGGVIEESALSAALMDGRIGGAALDVFEAEPPSGGILAAPNTVLTPHIGGQTEEAQEDAIVVVGEKVRAFFQKA